MTYQEHQVSQAAIRNQILACDACALGETANRVPWTGITWAPKLILLGEAPGSNENLAREPFVGRAGELLNSILHELGLTRNHVMIANTVCCRPPQNRDPELTELAACEPNRVGQINLARTWVGVTLGRVAVGVLKNDVGAPMGENLGRPFWAYGKIWMPTYHPAYALRKPGARTIIKVHIEQALEWLKGRDVPEPKQKGYTVERGCLIIENESTRPPNPGPFPTFSRIEWSKVRYLSDDALAGVIQAKKQLGAEVVR